MAGVPVPVRDATGAIWALLGGDLDNQARQVTTLALCPSFLFLMLGARLAVMPQIFALSAIRGGTIHALKAIRRL